MHDSSNSTVRFSFDGVQGVYDDLDDAELVDAAGYGSTYREALEMALDLLLGDPEGEYDHIQPDQIRQAFERAAAAAGIDPDSTEEVDRSAWTFAEVGLGISL